MTKSLFVLSLLLAISAPSQAEEPISPAYARCMDQLGGVTVEMLNCIAAETKRQDARLNKAYKKVGLQLSETRKKQLTAAQRFWIQYRDANCRFYADPEGGSFAAVTSNECFLTETADRAKELELIDLDQK